MWKTSEQPSLLASARKLPACVCASWRSWIKTAPRFATGLSIWKPACGKRDGAGGACAGVVPRPFHWCRADGALAESGRDHSLALCGRQARPGLAVDSEGNVYVAHVDTSGRIRKITSGGLITTLAEVPATKLTTSGPVLYAVSGDRVVRVEPDGMQRVIAGGNGIGFSGDGGPATNAAIYARKQAHGLAIDRDGNLYFSDGDNRRIRAVRYGAVLAPPNATIQTSVEGSRIRAVIFDSSGKPAPGVRVDFAAPASGASCMLSSPFAVTDGSGAGSVTCTPNCAAGTYTVTARPLAASIIASVSFTNGGGPCRRRAVRR